MTSAVGRMLTARTWAFGQTTMRAQPGHVQSSSTRTARAGRARRTNDEAKEPTRRQAPNAATAVSGNSQNGRRSRTIAAASTPIATTRTPSAASMSRLRSQRSAASPAGSERSAAGSRRERDEAGMRRRADHREHEQRVGDRRRVRPDRRQQLPRLEQREVAIPVQANAAHGLTLLRLRCCDDVESEQHYVTTQAVPFNARRRARRGRRPSASRRRRGRRRRGRAAGSCSNASTAARASRAGR